MRTIDALGLLDLWERGYSRHSIDRSVLLCAWARPELSADTIGDLPLGEITSNLLQLRLAWFGEHISGHFDCEHCGERLEVAVGAHELLGPGDAVRGRSGIDASCSDAAAEFRDVMAAGLNCRLPSLRDLAAIANEQDVDAAARQLVARCLRGSAGGADAEPVSEERFRQIEDALEQADPNADLAFVVRCEVCGNLGAAQLDVGELLWDEIDVRARVLLREVHLLARAYGWTEGEILGLSSERRARYLSLLTA